MSAIEGFIGLIKKNTVASIITSGYVFVWFTQVGKRIPIFDAIRLEFVLGILLSVMAAVTVIGRGRSRSNPLSVITIILIIYYGLFVIFSFDRDLSWTVYFNRVIKFSLMSLFIAVFIDTIPKIKLLLFSYFLASLKAGQEGLHGWLTGNMVWESQGVPRLHGSIDMYGHPNSFSGFAVGLLPFIYCFYPICNKWMKVGLIFLFVSAVVIILFTGSRTGYVAVSALLLWLLFRRKSRWKIKAFVLSAICLSVLVVAVPDSYKDRFFSVFTQEDIEGGSIDARKQIVIDAVNVFAEYPFGVGIGAFPKVRQDMFSRSQDTHNLYLEVLTNVGLIGLVLFLIFVVKILRTNYQIKSQLKEDDNSSKFLRALTGSIIGYIWARLLLGMFGMDMYEIYWWFALGLTISSYHCCRRLQLDKAHSLRSWSGFSKGRNLE